MKLLISEGQYKKLSESRNHSTDCINADEETEESRCAGAAR